MYFSALHHVLMFILKYLSQEHLEQYVNDENSIETSFYMFLMSLL